MKTLEVIANAGMRSTDLFCPPLLSCPRCESCLRFLEYLDEILCHRCADELEAM